MPCMKRFTETIGFVTLVNSEQRRALAVTVINRG